MEQKKYQDITRLGHKTTIGVLKEGDSIVIQEKIDGANASFMKDGNQVRSFSRNRELDEGNTLGGFYQFVKENIDPDKLLDGVIYYGEWTNAHKVKYPENQKKFFMYDIFIITKELTMDGYYESFTAVRLEADRLGLEVVPVFYEGEYISFEHLLGFVGKTSLGGRLGDVETGEGIVVKNVGYKDRFGNQKFVKLVTDAFREVQRQKAPKDPKISLTQEQQFVSEVVTDARIEKFLYKFIDEGIIDEEYGIEDMGVILKNMNVRIQEDIIKEESEMLPSDYDPKQLSKSIARTVAITVKNIISSKANVLQ